MQFTLFNGDLFSKSAISQFLLGNILQTRQICLFMDCIQMDQETDFAQCSDPRRRPERRGEDEVIRRRSDDEEASKVVDMAPLENIKEVTFFPRAGGGSELSTQVVKELVAITMRWATGQHNKHEAFTILSKETMNLMTLTTLTTLTRLARLMTLIALTNLVRFMPLLTFFRRRTTESYLDQCGEVCFS